MEVKQATPVFTRKAARQLIENTLQSLSDLKSMLGDKKFERRVKKAGRLLTDGLPKTMSKKNQKIKKVVDTAA